MLTNAKCTNCGAMLTVDEQLDAAICQHCGSAFIVEKAINHYRVSNTINANTVNVYTTAEDFVVRSGVLEKYNGAEADVVLPESVRVIGERAFEGCAGLLSVTIPGTVVEIEDHAFSGCRRLRRVHLEEGLTHIGKSAFEDCKSLERIELPASVLTVDECAFEGCSALETLVIRGAGTGFRLPNSSELFFNFSGCSSLTAIEWPSATMTDALEYAFNGSAWYYRRHNCCSFCGNEFKGFVRKVCRFCHRPKDY